MTNAPTQGPSPGFFLSKFDARMISTPGCSKGDVQQINEAVVDSVGKHFTTVIAPTGEQLGIYCVALEDVAAGAEGRFRFRGPVEAKVTGAVGVELEAATPMVAVTADSKVVGIAQELGTTTGLTRVLFNGVEGLAHRSV